MIQFCTCISVTPCIYICKNNLLLGYSYLKSAKYEGHSKGSKTNSKKISEYGNPIELCRYSHLIWLPYSEFFFF